MNDLTSEIVDSAIRHARRLSTTKGYDWPTARAALEKILADLETRAPGEPSLVRLRRFIASRNRAWSKTQGGA